VILDKVPLSQVEVLLEREDIPRSTYYAKLTVQDSGPGVPDDVIDHVFEPFFTTKEVGKGTGMGLAATHGIATTSHGAITVSNLEEGGACFEVFIPIADAMPQAGMETPPEEVLQPSGKHCPIDVLGNVLYVDDEISLTNVMGKFLERQGFDVDVANDPLQALALFTASPDKYHVVVSDQVMPNMRGDQLAEEILKLRPKLPLVICSGYSESLNVDKVQSLGVREFLQKPLDFKMFSELLKKLVKEYET
jgi:CheY-like chemotaxis protein